MTKEKTAAEEVNEIADRQIEEIRLLLCPEESDVAFDADRGLFTLDDYIEIEPKGDPNDWREDAEDGTQTGELDLESFVSDEWDTITEYMRDRFHEHGLSFSYVEGDDGEAGHFCYLISTGGPGTEIRFYTDPGFCLYRAEFWYLPWFDGASKDVTKDPTVQMLWDQFQECSAEHVYREATGRDSEGRYAY